MEAKHTQGELHIDQYGHIYGPAVETDDPEITAGGKTKTLPYIAAVQGGARPGDGARLVACWNACQSIPTDALEAGVVGKLLAECMLRALEAALAKAKGGK
jgi:hypothetical protein